MKIQLQDKTWPLLPVRLFRLSQEKFMVYWSERLMDAQLNKFLEGKCYNWVLCFPNEPFPGWAKSVHFLLVNSNLVPRDNPLPKHPICQHQCLDNSRRCPPMVWPPVWGCEESSPCIPECMVLFTKCLSRRSCLKPSKSAMYGKVSGNHSRLLDFLLPRTKERTGLINICFAGSVGFSTNYYFFGAFSVCQHAAVHWTHYDKQDGCPLLSEFLTRWIALAF